MEPAGGGYRWFSVRGCAEDVELILAAVKKAGGSRVLAGCFRRHRRAQKTVCLHARKFRHPHRPAFAGFPKPFASSAHPPRDAAPFKGRARDNARYAVPHLEALKILQCKKKISV
ncbi:TPA: hypothetical protein ACFP4U_001644 [Neisseria lactamica]|uniref:hypothetical protein n=1 Tax=Neisseria TaxID=482 RepID=UPI001EFCD1A4|nr:MULTISPECIES: hypothetical protein [Neisseria]